MRDPFVFVRNVTVGFALLASGSAFAQSCQMGPSCQSISARVNSYVGRVTSGSISGVHEPALKTYCVNWVGEVAAKRCADELVKMGRADCAGQARAQAAQFAATARQAKATAGATAATGDWQAKCGWK